MFFHIVKISDGNFEIAGLSHDKKMWYNLPMEEPGFKTHSKPSKVPIIKNAVAAAQSIKSYQEVRILLYDKFVP